MDHPDFSKLSPEVQQAERLYAARLKTLLEPACNGKFVAIELASGDYFVADELLDAFHKGSKKHPGKTFVFKRIGYAAARFVGSR